MFVSQSCIGRIENRCEWLNREIKQSKEIIESKGFPCVFGIQGHKKEVHFYSALNYPYSPEELSKDIDLYLNELKKMPKKDRGISGLLVYFEPIGNMSIHAKQFMVWQLLSSMKNKYGYKKDNIDNNPLDDGYAYRFKNELWFINFSSNSYKHRKSRNLGAFITLAMQTLSKSDEYFNYNMETKAKAQKNVRKLAEKYDGCPVHSGLGPVIGSGKFSPAKLSYFIGDTNSEKSYEPWKFQAFRPQKIILDESIISENGPQVKHFECLYGNEKIKRYSNCKEEHDINENNLLVTNSSDLVDLYNSNIQIATFNKNIASEYNVFDIDYMNDLLALRFIKDNAIYN
ncbi:YqcI/YcgG family protein [Staphylococcus warneri]|uniref:YqcI/YcgG family protein n=1 Tax=Staphylococcus warneri TaxID=1292 RepID=UPI000735372F|nr:YqcI/YcgG family protein [Staphylococcus warneri]PNN17769.1 YqcI/YcgG family protein [Staphylococcus warneri]